MHEALEVGTLVMALVTLVVGTALAWRGRYDMGTFFLALSIINYLGATR